MGDAISDVIAEERGGIGAISDVIAEECGGRGDIFQQRCNLTQIKYYDHRA